MHETSAASRPSPFAPPHAGAGPSPAPRLTLSAVSRLFGTRTALDDVSLDVPDGEILAVLGPSGSGKSTLLRLIAGLDRPTSGTIRLGGREVASAGVFVEPERRGVGMVFQDYALFPHLSAARNVAFGLRARSRADAARTARSWLERVGLAGRADAWPHELSGGERQRVALARALAPAPALLLLDEPFASLDASLRARVRAETIGLLRMTGTTAVLVTHDAAEAHQVADRIAVFESGRLVATHRTGPLLARSSPVESFA